MSRSTPFVIKVSRDGDENGPPGPIYSPGGSSGSPSPVTVGRRLSLQRKGSFTNGDGLSPRRPGMQQRSRGVGPGLVSLRPEPLMVGTGNGENLALAGVQKPRQDRSVGDICPRRRNRSSNKEPNTPRTLIAKVKNGLNRPPTPGRGLQLPTLTLTHMTQQIVQAGKAKRDSMKGLDGAPGSPGSQEKIFHLPRGGYLVHTKAGPVQFGMPPETIKDHMSMGMNVPTTYVVPFQRFHKTMAINVAEFEFPAYFNFFVLRKRLRLLCTTEGERHVRSVFQETLLGPRHEFLVHSALEDYHSSIPAEDRADFVKEMVSLAVNPFDRSQALTVDLLIEFVCFDGVGDDEMGTVTGAVAGAVAGEEAGAAAGAGAGEQDTKAVVDTKEADSTGEGGETEKAAWTVDLGDGVKIAVDFRHKGERQNADITIEYCVTEDGVEIARVPDEVKLPKLTHRNNVVGLGNNKLAKIPLFGVTFMGTSHGFDPRGSTTGFVLWMHGRGILVDPPPHAGVILQMMGVPARMVDTVILTHCHADHDAGTFQKLLHEGQVTLITTQTIMQSFLRKYSALAGVDQHVLRRLFTYRRCRIGSPISIRGGEISFFYTMHTIPCVGFKATFRGKTIAYSADTLNDPERLTQMHTDGILSKGRLDTLLNFPWDADLILHEAGVPPIHTPATYLGSLSDDVKRRMYLVHTDEKSVPRGLGLRVAAEGAENTIVLDVPARAQDEITYLLEVLSGIEQLRSMSLPTAQELLRLLHTTTIDRDQVLDGCDGEVFLVVLSGRVTMEVGFVGERGGTDIDGQSQVSLSSTDNRGRTLSNGSETTPDSVFGDNMSEASFTSAFENSTNGSTWGRVQDDVSDSKDAGGALMSPDVLPGDISGEWAPLSRNNSFLGLGGDDDEGRAPGSIVLSRGEFCPPQSFWKGGHGASTYIQGCYVRRVVGGTDGTLVAFVQLRELNLLLKSSAGGGTDDDMLLVKGVGPEMIQRFLRSSKLLPTLSSSQCAELAHMMIAVTYDEAQHIWQRGENAIFAFFLVEGTVESVTDETGTEPGRSNDGASVSSADPKEVQKGALQIDESFWDGQARYANTLRASSDVEGFVITIRDLRRFVAHAPNFLLHFRERRGRAMGQSDTHASSYKRMDSQRQERAASRTLKRRQSMDNTVAAAAVKLAAAALEANEKE